MLKERIEKEIEKKLMQTGYMGTEQITVTIKVSEEEKKEVRTLPYEYQLFKDILYIFYSEE